MPHRSVRLKRTLDRQKRHQKGLERIQALVAKLPPPPPTKRELAQRQTDFERDDEDTNQRFGE